MELEEENQIILSIKVKGLFGIYDYNIPEEGHLKHASILYGDNGAGKSTVLRLAFHLLSAAPDRGHRHALYNSNFNYLEVTLSNGTTLSATKTEGDRGYKNLRLEIKKEGSKKLSARWDFIPKTVQRDDEIYKSIQEEIFLRIRNKRNANKASKGTSEELVFTGEEAYIDAIKRVVPNTFILNADRRLDSDSVSDPSDEMELRRIMRYEEPKRINDLVTRSKEIALTQALASASKWISRKVLQSANKGTENVHTVYATVLQHVLGKASSIQTPDDQREEKLSKRLEDIEIKTKKFAIYEFSTPLSTEQFREAVLFGIAEKRKLATDLITPYIESLESRLDTVEPIYKIVDKFVNMINKLLVDKELTFTVNQGFSIYDLNKSPLEPGQLSSGEQQLLLLFCYVLTGRDRPCVFMIDEPEISLNVKWQRELIQYLLDLTDGSNIQFIFASHSMEILSQHWNSVIRLGRGDE